MSETNDGAPSRSSPDHGKPLEARGVQPNEVTGSFDNPLIYQAFVRSLCDSIGPRLATDVDGDVAIEIAGLTRLLNVMPPNAVDQNRVFFELAYRLLQAHQPNLELIRSLRRDLAAVNDKYVGGLSRLLLFLCGKTLLNAILSALLTIFVMSFAFMLVMSGGVKLIFLATSAGNPDIRLLQVLKGPSFNELLLTAHAAFLGSVVSIMARIRSFLSDPTLTPLMMYVSLVTRPIISVLVAVLAFCTIKSGMVSFHSIDLDGQNGYYIAWAIGFLCGFSERLAQNFVVGAAGSLPASTPNAAK